MIRSISSDTVPFNNLANTKWSILWPVNVILNTLNWESEKIIDFRL